MTKPDIGIARFNQTAHKTVLVVGVHAADLHGFLEACRESGIYTSQKEYDLPVGPMFPGKGYIDVSLGTDMQANSKFLVEKGFVNAEDVRRASGVTVDVPTPG